MQCGVHTRQLERERERVRHNKGTNTPADVKKTAHHEEVHRTHDDAVCCAQHCCNYHPRQIGRRCAFSNKCSCSSCCSSSSRTPHPPKSKNAGRSGGSFLSTFLSTVCRSMCKPAHEGADIKGTAHTPRSQCLLAGRLAGLFVLASQRLPASAKDRLGRTTDHIPQHLPRS